MNIQELAYGIFFLIVSIAGFLVRKKLIDYIKRRILKTQPQPGMLNLKKKFRSELHEGFAVYYEITLTISLGIFFVIGILLFIGGLIQ